MGMTTALLVNVALGVIAACSTLVLAAWAIRTGEPEPPGRGWPPPAGIRASGIAP